MMQDDAIKRVIAQVVREYLAQSSAPGTPPSGAADDGSAVCLHADGSFTAPVEASARHVHLSQQDVERLFGAGYRLRPKKYLSQPGQFLSEERVTVKGPKGQFANVAVLGPVRSATQVEISLSDARVLGVDPPIAMSGDLRGAADVELSTERVSMLAKGSCIVAQNHLHMSGPEAARAGLRDGDLVDIVPQTGRPVTFRNVVVRAGKGHKLAVHLDFDEANACMLGGGAPGLVCRSGCSCGASGAGSLPQTGTGVIPGAGAAVMPEAGCVLTQGDVLVQTGFLTEFQIRKAMDAGAEAIVLKQGTIISPLGKDMIRKYHLQIKYC